MKQREEAKNVARLTMENVRSSIASAFKKMIILLNIIFSSFNAHRMPACIIVLHPQNKPTIT
jgi:hypothetical protein